MTIHWFRRDLRVQDNTALLAARAETDLLIPLFILDPRLLETSRGGGGPRVAFMRDGLRALAASLQQQGSHLVLRQGEPLGVLQRLIQQTGASRLVYNRDYSPYARQRDRQVVEALRGDGLTVETFQDQALHEYKAILTDQGTPYQVFTPYKKRWFALEKPRPQPLEGALPPLPSALATQAHLLEHISATPAPEPIAEAGEEAAHARLDAFAAQGMAAYAEARNLLAEDGTSRLSPYLRWGMLSIRQAYAKADLETHGGEVWASELAWRDFYQMVLAHHPRVLHQSYRPEYDQIQWQGDEADFGAWQRGETGFPVVDAAMRQLRATGWMHNRARMIVASFLCKDLLLDWRLGEAYFMQGLLDGDTAANNGGWQWAAGTGTDAAPYFRIFNPTTQGEKFDPQGTYIRRWVPELADVPARFIHQLQKAPQRAALNYPQPMVDHQQQRKQALAMYQVAVKGGGGQAEA
ncbi:MAG: deoxyribodipyrimidine photo-lyase [Anaerolineae bacterium]|nr:deoxyribodipyrimidine photo-lyase [Anaerolineae bacterium]